jgi:hypothetical protein
MDANAERPYFFQTRAKEPAEKSGEALGFLFGGAAHPGRGLSERFDHDFDSGALELMSPRSLHVAVDQKNGRDPTLRPVDAAAQAGGKELFGVA